MTAGGYIFEKVDLAYDANTNGLTVRSWAYAVHQARCEAFIKATKREQTNFEGNGWSGIQTSLYNEISDSYDGVDYYIQDVHPDGLGPTDGYYSVDYPAFISFFRMNNESCEYCIITTRNYHCNPNYTNPASDFYTGLYLNIVNLRHGNGPEFGQSLGHAYAEYGFNNYDVSSNSMLTTYCTPLSPAYCYNKWNNTNYTDQSASESIIRVRATSQSSSYLVGKTYSFGYAVKGNHIETFMRRRDCTHWMWSLIGNIIDKTIIDGDTSKVCALCNAYINDVETYQTYGNLEQPANFSTYMCSFTDNQGNIYDSTNYLVRTYYSCFADNPITRVNSEYVNDGILYSAVFVGAFLTVNSSSYSGDGIDGHGNGAKGYINTDCLRMISNQLCRVAGTTFQGGNFVAMKSGDSSYGVGYILGWDPSNESIM